VTIFGESAGGMSVGTLLGLPAADGLFARAIVQSGSSSYAIRSDLATKVARDVLGRAGVRTVEELRSVPAETLLRVQGEMLAGHARTELPFMPVIDGVVLPDLPLHTVASGATGAVPTMIGTTRDEMTLFLSLDLRVGEIDAGGLNRQMAKVFGDRSAEVVAAYTANRPGESAADVLTALSTDRSFRIPSIRLAEAQVANGRPTYMYLFTWATPVMGGKLKSCHALELPFVWDALDRPGLSQLTGDGPERQAIADAMHSAWIAFARTGDPGWPQYELEHRATQRFDTTCEVVDDPMGAERELWTGVL
jgi:carboxylesterase type B